eukprot:539910_1
MTQKTLEFVGKFVGIFTNINSSTMTQKTLEFVNYISDAKYISDTARLDKHREGLITACNEYKIKMVPVENKKSSLKLADEGDECIMDDEKIENEMFDHVAKMNELFNIKGTELETLLLQYEKTLISTAAKKSIASHCQFCEETTPNGHPDDIYLCKSHEASLYKKLEEYKIKIPTKNCSKEAERNCIKLQNLYENIKNSLQEDNQIYNQQQFPKDYFSVTMTKLLSCERTLKTLSVPKTQLKSKKQMKIIVKHLMDLLIIVRQNMNPTAVDICTMILSVASTIGAGVAWMVTNSAFITVLCGFLTFFVGIIIAGVIFGSDKMKFVSGAAAVGTVLGFVGAGTGTAMLVVEESSKYGAMIGTFCGGPGAGTLVGAAIGGIAGGLFAGGLAAMYKFR